MQPTDPELLLAALYRVYSATQEQKQTERVVLLLLSQFLENEPSAVWDRAFGPDIQTSPVVQKAVVAARRRVPKHRQDQALKA